MSFSPFLLLCLTGLFAIFSSTISKSPVLPLFASHLGADAAGVGLIASVSAFTGVMFSIPAGLLSDRTGKKRMLFLSGFIFCTAPILYLFVNSIWQLAAVRFYHGFATAIFLPAAMAMVSELYHRERGEKMGWFSTATLLGRFMAPLTGGGIIGLFTMHPDIGYKTVYIVCCAAGALTLLLCLFLPGHEVTAHNGRTWTETLSSFKGLVSDRVILATCAVEAAILFAYGTFETFLPLYAASLGISPSETGIFLSAQVITLALSKPLMGRFSDRHGRRPQILWGAMFGALCIGLFSLFSSSFFLLAISVAFGMGLSVVTSATSSYIADLSSRNTRGSAMGLLGSIMDMGHTTGPIASGVIASALGFGASFIGASAVLIFAGVAFSAVSNKEQNP